MLRSFEATATCKKDGHTVKCEYVKAIAYQWVLDFLFGLRGLLKQHWLKEELQWKKPIGVICSQIPQDTPAIYLCRTMNFRAKCSSMMTNVCSCYMNIK